MVIKVNIKKIYNENIIKYIINDIKYEFIINNNEAIINYNNIIYLEGIVNEFHLLHPNICYYHSNDYNFEMRFDKLFSFKLPINIIQPTKLFLNENYIKDINNINYDEITFPVNIINDEYVLLKGHHLLYQALNDDIRMVNVYIKEYDESLNNILYILKEQNINNINNLEILDENNYNNMLMGLEMLKGL